MGIQGLEGYLLSAHASACPRVNIAELAQQYR